MKFRGLSSLRQRRLSPLAEGRELKYLCQPIVNHIYTSPLAEGRELKCLCIKTVYNELLSPLAEGRELK